MGRKKNKQKFKPIDMNNLPSTSSAKNFNKKSNVSVSTSDGLSVTPSQAKEKRIDTASTQFNKEILNYESKNDIEEGSCSPLRGSEVKGTDSASFARSDRISSNDIEDSTEYTITPQYSEDVAGKFQNVTLEPSHVIGSDLNYCQKKHSNAESKTKSHYRDRSGNDGNYTNKTSNDFNERNRPPNRSGFNDYTRETHYNSGGTRNRRTYQEEPSKHDSFNKKNQHKHEYKSASGPWQSTDHKSQEYTITPKYSEEVVGKFQNVTLESPHVIGSDLYYSQNKHSNAESKTKSHYRDRSGNDGNYTNKTSNDFNERNRPPNRSGFNDYTREKHNSGGTRSRRTYQEEPNKHDSYNKKNQHKHEYKSASGPWQRSDHKSEEKPSLNDTSPEDPPKPESWDQNEQESSMQKKSTVTEKGNSNSGEDSDWDDGTELNASAKTFVPNQPWQERVETAEGEIDQTEDDHWNDSISNKTPCKSEIYPERQARRGYSLGIWETKESTFPKRRSEGNNQDRKEESRYFLDRSFEKSDEEYRKFRDEERKHEKIEYLKVNEIQGDLFEMGKEYSLAHCVAQDMRMGSGIAVNFRRDFKDMDVLLNMRTKQGGLAVLENETEKGTRYIYYLVTKRVSNGKPTYETLWSSLKKMRDHIKEKNVEKLAIPRLGCGLDRLEWTRVKHMIEFLFKNFEIEIMVCNFQQTEESPEKPFYTCKVVNVIKPVTDIEEETTIIYLSTEDGHVSTEMEMLNKKWSFLDEFKRTKKQLGVPIKYKVPNKFYVLYGCIVRKTKKDPFDFVNFRKCVSMIDKNCKKDSYVYVAIQAIEDDDDLINEKLVTILRNYLHKVDVYVCWDGSLVSKMPT